LYFIVERDWKEKDPKDKKITTPAFCRDTARPKVFEFT
jgi:hypothetical protein